MGCGPRGRIPMKDIKIPLIHTISITKKTLK